MEKICCFLSGLKMTVVSMIFLLLSAVIMVFKINSPFEFAWITIVFS